jgi:hypothetical protein
MDTGMEDASRYPIPVSLTQPVRQSYYGPRSVTGRTDTFFLASPAGGRESFKLTHNFAGNPDTARLYNTILSLFKIGG